MEKLNDTFSQIAESIKGEAALRSQELSEAEKRVLMEDEAIISKEPSLEEQNTGTLHKEEINEAVSVLAVVSDGTAGDAGRIETQKTDEVSVKKEEDNSAIIVDNIENYRHKMALINGLDDARSSAGDNPTTDGDSLPPPTDGKLLGMVVDESVMEMPAETIKKKGLKGPLVKFGTAFIAFILLIYVLGIMLFCIIFPPCTYIGDIECGLKSRSSVAEEFAANQYEFEIFLQGRENCNAIIMSKDIDAVSDYDTGVIKNAGRNALQLMMWPVYAVKGHTYLLPVNISYSSEKLQASISESDLMASDKKRQPTDAYLGYDEVSGSIEIIPEDGGTTPDEEKLFNAISYELTTVNAGQAQVIVNLDEQNCYLEPKVFSDDEELLEAKEEAAYLSRASITYDWNGSEVVVDGRQISEWLKIDNSKVSLDQEKVAEFVEETAAVYDTYNMPYLFTTTDGRQIEIERHGYGWKTDTEAETAALIENIEKGEVINKEPVYSYTGYVKGSNDIGESYVEIDLTAQHLYLYVEGQLELETDLVSGGPPNGDYTPDGIYGITYKTTNAILRGPGYETPVSYWMPYNGSIGMHDASWRSEFGEEIYKTSGSHGCVNLPPQAAATIYGYVCTNFPVVSYW